jgi:radical S-adenosyl methionine domain-containing protein 2
MTLGQLPPIIDLRITGRCNLRCPFCFGPRHAEGEVDVARLKELVRSFPDRGVRAVVLTGGEPTLVQSLPDLLVECKNVGLQTVLSTNGVAIQRRLDEIAGSLDWIALPIDGDKRAVNEVMRVGSRHQFDGVLGLLETVRKDFPTIGIKLGTVACALNLSAVPGIPRLFSRYSVPDVWKIYQVVYSSYGRDNRPSLELADVDFERTVRLAEVEAAALGMPIVSYWRRERAGKSLFLEPNGDALVTSDDGEVRVGNFFADISQVCLTWPRYVNLPRMVTNFDITYPRERQAV